MSACRAASSCANSHWRRHPVGPRRRDGRLQPR